MPAPYKLRRKAFQENNAGKPVRGQAAVDVGNIFAFGLEMSFIRDVLAPVTIGHFADERGGWGMNILDGVRSFAPNWKDARARFIDFIARKAMRSLVVATLSTLPLGGVLADYKLDSGDVLDISIFGRSELQRRTTVSVDGDISLPLIGEIHVSGLSIAEARAQIATLFAPGESFRSRDVLIEVAESRPFYIAGEILRPGAYPYKAGLTVLHAVALSGGTVRGPEERGSPGSELGTRLALLRMEYVKQQVRIASLTAELADRPSIDLQQLQQKAPEAEIGQIVDLENRVLLANKVDREREKQFFRRAIELADEQITALQNGVREELENARQQAAELERIVELNRKGLSNLGRVADEQRAASLLKSRQMDTSARLARARQEREELLRKLEKVDDRQARVPRELQEAIVSLEGLRAQLGALATQMDASAFASMGSQATQFYYEIRRKSDSAVVWFNVTEDTVIEPGDLIRISRSHVSELSAKIQER